MQIVRELSDLGPALSGWRSAGETIALVPTMGALHPGHMALVDAARQAADKVLASIFVNPLQFNDKGDLDRYPRTEDADIARLEAAGCDVVWLPTPQQLYPQGFATSISVKGVSERWEGTHRSGHFDGVATVVAKLFIACMPDVAIFGEKDWQQLAVIRRMTADLGLPIEIIGHPTVREDDGLAMSSRNALLSDAERRVAPVLAASLTRAAGIIASGGSVGDAVSDCIDALKGAGFGPIDYVAYVDGGRLEPLERFAPDGRLIAAAFLGKVRLIDNVRGVSATG
jgi:pantoate--beta-alanine ligase